MENRRERRHSAASQASSTNAPLTVSNHWHWLQRPGGRILIQVLIFLTAFPPWAWGDLSASYRWSTTPYLQTFARLVTLIESDTPSVTPLPPADFTLAQATSPAPAVAATPNPDFADAVWVAKNTIVKLAAATGSRLLELTDIKNARALALDAPRGVLWAYGHRDLHAYQFNGTPLLRIPVPRSGGNSASGEDDCDDDGGNSSGDDDDDDDDCSDGDGHVALAVNWHNGTVWLGTNKTLRHFSHEGKLLGTFPLPHHVRALVFDPSQARLWVGTKISVKAHNDAGTVVQTINLGANPDVQDLALQDNSSGELWVALKDTLRRYSRTGTLLRQLTVKQIAVLASDGRGQVWASTNVALLRIDLTGKILLTLAQFKGESQLVALATDPVDLSVWAASKKTVWEVSAQGKVLHTVDFRTGPPIHDLVVSVDTTAPVLTFVEPAEGAVLTIYKPTLKLSYRDSGQGVNPDTLAIRHNNALLAVNCTHNIAIFKCPRPHIRSARTSRECRSQ